MRSPIVLCVLLLPGIAAAHSVLDEFTVGGTQTTPAPPAGGSPTPPNPASTYLSDRVMGLAQVIPKLALRLDATWTHDAATAAPPMANFPSSGGDIFAFDLGADWDLARHFTLAVDAIGSLPSATLSDSQIAYTATINGRTVSGTEDAQLKSDSWSVGGGLDLTYDQDSDGKFDAMADLGVNVTLFDTTQQYTAFYDERTMSTITAADIMARCTGSTTMTATCTRLLKGLMPQAAGLVQIKIAASFTETLWDNTDVTVGGAYYAYNKDPNEVGVYSKATVGRSGGSLDTQFGSGIAVAPYLFTIQPSLTQRIGKHFSATASFQFGQYVGETSMQCGLPSCVYPYDLNAGLKLQVKFATHWRIWLKATGQRDVDNAGNLSKTGFLSLGAKVSW